MENQDILALLDERIEAIARTVFHEVIGEAPVTVPSLDDGAVNVRAQLEIIKEKEHITVREAALLMSCSDSHIRKLVMLARNRKTRRPIPFVDLEGVTVFPVTTLLEWANSRPQFQVITNEAA